MPPLALKPDSSFFRKIALGAVGSRCVAEDLGLLGHDMIELERGAMDTKLWKDVKRKRVRIPDLVCTRCGVRVESRAKTRTELSMSHSPTDHERAWDFGMVDSDVIAFPVCKIGEETLVGTGRLKESVSYWHERNWIRWRAEGKVNYVRVAQFRALPPGTSATKGVTEGSETSVGWKARFSSRTGTVTSVQGQRITIRRRSDGHRHTQRIPDQLRLVVREGQEVTRNQIIASSVAPESEASLCCPKAMRSGHLRQLLESRERTQRFTGVKLARFRRERTLGELVAQMEEDQEEDFYIRLEAAAYLAGVRDVAADNLFARYLNSPDQQIQLEAVITLGEAGTDECVSMLSAILGDAGQPFFLRSAAAWCLSQVGGEEACGRLVRAFADVDPDVREEALDGIVGVTTGATPALLAGLQELDPAIAAGCAEALRRRSPLPEDAVREIWAQISRTDPSVWAVWLAGNLPRERLAAAVDGLQESAPQLHYAITLLWSFVESWVARRWELRPRAEFPTDGDGCIV